MRDSSVPGQRYEGENRSPVDRSAVAEPVERLLDFSKKWDTAKRRCGSFSGTIGMELPSSGVSCARFVYPAGKYSVMSSQHWGIGIVRKPFDVTHCSFGTANCSKRSVQASELIVSEPDAGFEAQLQSGTLVEYVIISKDRFDACLPEAVHDLSHLRHGNETFFHSPLLLHLVHALVERLAQDKADFDHYSDALTDAIVVELCKNLNCPKPERNKPFDALGRRELDIIDSFIRENIQNSISFQRLASLVGMNPTTFSKCFKSAFGKTPYQHVLDRRVELARTMLTTTELSIAEIAFACGFSSQSHITDVFAQRVGLTPGNFRKVVDT